jgi:hypothetical protein
MATKFFIVYIKSVASSNYKYDINTVSNIFVQELYACYFTVNLYRKIIYDPYDVNGRVESKQRYIFL